MMYEREDRTEKEKKDNADNNAGSFLYNIILEIFCGECHLIIVGLRQIHSIYFTLVYGSYTVYCVLINRHLSHSLLRTVFC